MIFFFLGLVNAFFLMTGRRSYYYCIWDEKLEGKNPTDHIQFALEVQTGVAFTYVLCKPF